MSQNNNTNSQYDYKKLFELTKKLLNCANCPQKYQQECRKILYSDIHINLPCEISDFWEKVLTENF